MGKKTGHFTALERRHVALALFSTAEMDNEDRGKSLDIMDDLDMKDEMFTLKMRGKLKELVPVPKLTKDAIKDDPNALQEAQEEYDQAVEDMNVKLDLEIVPFELEDKQSEHILAALNKTKFTHPSAHILSAEICRRLKKVIDGSYVAPRPLEALPPVDDSKGEPAQA